MANQNKLLEKIKEHLEDDEEVKYSVFGAYETKMMGNDTVRNGIFAATNKRVAFFAKKLTGFDLELFPYSNISSIDMGKNIMGHRITLFASGNKSSMKWIKTDGVSDFVAFVKTQMGKKSEEAVRPGGDAIDQLKRLAELKEKGIITDEEFAVKKKQLLGL